MKLPREDATPEDYQSPEWGMAGRVHDWRNYISDEVRRHWPRFSDDEKAMIARQAYEMAGREEWD